MPRKTMQKQKKRRNTAAFLSPSGSSASGSFTSSFSPPGSSASGNTKLRLYFPMLRPRREVLSIIQASPKLYALFGQWKTWQQTEFLDFCTGARGIKMLYDPFFKEVLNPEYAPERLSDLLSLLLGIKVTVKTVLPNDSTRITDETSLLITDIVVELTDGSLANVEVQKIGYAFPGQRSACYSSDLLLRQYRRLRDSRKKEFSYRDIKKVYTIILFDHSSSEFHELPDLYLHHFTQQSDTSLKLDLLQEYLFIPLDIFRKKMQNGVIKNKLDAWLVFLSMDDPEMIVRLIQTWPEFQPMYAGIYQIKNARGILNARRASCTA